MAKFLWVFVLLLSACSNHTSTQFYMLNAETGMTADAWSPAFDKNLIVGLGPIHLPDYLNRPQIVMEVSENQYKFDEHHRWIAPLDENIDSTLAKLLADRLGVEQIVRYPWAQRQPIDYQISVDILEFHQAADGASHLAAQWQIKQHEQTLLSKRVDYSIAAKAEPKAIVKAQSECLGRLGRDIEIGLRQLVKAS
jgi:uncharacterized lipoprotein YmbA